MSHFFFYPSLQYSLKPSYIPFPPQGSLYFLKIIAQWQIKLCSVPFVCICILIWVNEKNTAFKH